MKLLLSLFFIKFKIKNLNMFSKDTIVFTEKRFNQSIYKKNSLIPNITVNDESYEDEKQTLIQAFRQSFKKSNKTSANSASKFYINNEIRDEKKNRKTFQIKSETFIFNGHCFEEKFFSQFSFCCVCNEFIWGFNKKGYQCQNCFTSVHQMCRHKLIGTCSSIEETQV